MSEERRDVLEGLENLPAGPWQWDGGMDFSSGEWGQDTVLEVEVSCAMYCYGGTPTFAKVDGLEEAIRRIPELADEIRRLRKGMREAADSLDTIARMTGRDELLAEHAQVRGYAANRATVARALLPPEAP